MILLLECLPPIFLCFGRILRSFGTARTSRRTRAIPTKKYPRVKSFTHWLIGGLRCFSLPSTSFGSIMQLVKLFLLPGRVLDLGRGHFGISVLMPFSSCSRPLKTCSASACARNSRGGLQIFVVRIEVRVVLLIVIFIRKTAPVFTTQIQVFFLALRSRSRIIDNNF